MLFRRIKKLLALFTPKQPSLKAKLIWSHINDVAQPQWRKQANRYN
jgi:hypothetical protein